MTAYNPVSKGSRDFLCEPNLCMRIKIDILYTVWLSCLRIEIGFFQVKSLVTVALTTQKVPCHHEFHQWQTNAHNPANIFIKSP